MSGAGRRQRGGDGGRPRAARGAGLGRLGRLLRRARTPGAIDYTRVPRSPGSTLKPFLYALALERGVDHPGHGARRPRARAGRHRQRRRPLPRAAAAPRRPRQLAQRAGRATCSSASASRRGTRFLARPRPARRHATPARRYGLGLAIGGLPVTLERLVRAYTVLAGDGRLGELGVVRGQPARPRPPARLRGHRAPGHPVPRRPHGAPAQLPAHGLARVPVPGGGQDRHLARLPRRLGGGLVQPLPGGGLGRAPRPPADERAPPATPAPRALAQRVMLSLHPDLLDGFDGPLLPRRRGARAGAAVRPHRPPRHPRLRPGHERVGCSPAEVPPAHLRRPPPAGGRHPHRRPGLDRAPRRGVVAAAPSPTCRPATPTGRRATACRVRRRSRAGLLDGEAPAPSAAATLRIRITAAPADSRLLRDPETPPELATLALRPWSSRPSSRCCGWSTAAHCSSPTTPTPPAGRSPRASTSSRPASRSRR